ncbi:MAG: hypothetical protein V1725_07265 [archaeon]
MKENKADIQTHKRAQLNEKKLNAICATEGVWTGMLRTDHDQYRPEYGCHGYSIHDYWTDHFCERLPPLIVEQLDEALPLMERHWLQKARNGNDPVFAQSWAFHKGFEIAKANGADKPGLERLARTFVHGMFRGDHYRRAIHGCNIPLGLKELMACCADQGLDPSKIKDYAAEYVMTFDVEGEVIRDESDKTWLEYLVADLCEEGYPINMREVYGIRLMGLLATCNYELPEKVDALFREAKTKGHDLTIYQGDINVAVAVRLAKEGRLHEKFTELVTTYDKNINYEDALLMATTFVNHYDLQMDNSVRRKNLENIRELAETHQVYVPELKIPEKTEPRATDVCVPDIDYCADGVRVRLANPKPVAGERYESKFVLGLPWKSQGLELLADSAVKGPDIGHAYIAETHGRYVGEAGQSVGGGRITIDPSQRTIKLSWMSEAFGTEPRILTALALAQLPEFEEYTIEGAFEIKKY